MIPRIEQLRDALREINSLQHKMAIELDYIPQQPRIEYWTRKIEAVIDTALGRREMSYTEKIEEQIRELQIAVLLLAQTCAPNLKADWGDYAEAIEAIRRRVEVHEEEGKYGLRQRK